MDLIRGHNSRVKPDHWSWQTCAISMAQKAKGIIAQADYVLSTDFALRPSGWCYYEPLRKTNKFLHSFSYQAAISPCKLACCFFRCLCSNWCFSPGCLNSRDTIKNELLLSFLIPQSNLMLLNCWYLTAAASAWFVAIVMCRGKDCQTELSNWDK